MIVSVATDAKTPGSNEDAWIVAGDVAVVVDGATERTETGCSHGTAWYARQLAALLAARAAGPESLAAALAGAIGAVADLHRDRCDLTHPGSPSALLAAARWRGDVFEYLVLGDVALIVEGPSGGVQVFRRDHGHVGAEHRAAAARFPIGHPSQVRALERMKRAEHLARNTPGGYWAASTDPGAADHAITGTIPRHEVTQLMIASDGITRLCDLFGSGDAASLLWTGIERGPRALIDEVRAHESADPDGHRYPRSKRHDDATGVVIRLAAPSRVSGPNHPA